MPEISPALYRAGEGEPLVLIHGFTATWRCWLPVLAELVPRFEVIAPTLHGHDGGPELPPEWRGDDVGDAADHLEGHLDELSPAGGLDASDREVARRVIRTFTRMQRGARGALPRAGFLMRSPSRRRLGLRDVMARGDQVPAREAEALIRSSTRCAIVGDVYAALRNGTASLQDLDRVACPVLVAWGDRDRVLPMADHAARLRAEIPGGQFRVLPGLGHTPMWDDPGLIAATIADFAAAMDAGDRAASSSAP